VIACGGFDAVLLWDILSSTPSDKSFTWYYAAPTMHHAIIQESDRRVHDISSNAVMKERLRENVNNIRFVANAAGALLPILADELRRIFPKAVILTSYGMTECMPISTPTQNYAMNPVGTSGQPTGPEIIITDEEHSKVLRIGEVKEIPPILN
jgi:acyl-CoA synthetase (AMP-forming)/AMP-acid ligase II